ncbi:MAG: hypothetical protein J3K34DRAFT_44084 [Monoraphidium minutum]|nr:MAG: hypothetical protein J3K34DRAFT_44084 [Monoraphidium minutum]
MLPHRWMRSARHQQNREARPAPSAARWRTAARAGALGAAASVVCMAAAPGAAHARAPKRLPRAQQVLDYLASHPMAAASQAMQYDAAPTTPLPACAAGLGPDDVLPPPPATKRDSAARQQYARVIAGVLYVAVGGLDQAHNLVTPLCWSSWTPYGGAPIPGSPAERDASYVHALIHRQEGSHDGEFGSGWSNANYWYASSGAALHPIAPRLAAAARELAKGNPELERHAAAAFGGGGGSGGGGAAWDPPRFVALCERAAGGGDAALAAWCGRVMGREAELLVDHCYAAAAAAAAGG